MVFIAGGLIVGNYFYNLALNPGTDRSEVFSADHNQMEQHADNTQGQKEITGQEWIESVDVQEETLTSVDGLRLNAYKILNEKAENKWVVMAHGYTSRADETFKTAIRFYNEGFHILLPDARGHGKSEGEYIGMGWPERKDMVQWIEKIVAEYPGAQIILYGVSMGGATVMMTAGEDLPSNVRAVVEDCGYTSAKDECSYQIKEIFGLPAFPVINFASLVTKLRAGYTLGEASAVKQLEKTKLPILFIHGTADTFVPFSMLDEVYDAAGGEKEKFAVEGAGHGMAAAVAGEQYWEKVFTFINKFMDPAM